MVERFDPSWAESWTNYLQWSKLFHLKEVVSLDCSLCPAVLRSFTNDDWDHAVYAEYVTAVFDDLKYAESRVPESMDRSRLQLLALCREPSAEDVQLALPGFELMGFDLIEEATSISALTNCGGFEGAFSNDDLNGHGLIAGHERATQIRSRLLELYPEEAHANCAVWAIWRRSA